MQKNYITAALAVMLTLITVTSANAQLPGVRAYAGTGSGVEDSGTVRGGDLFVSRESFEDRPNGSWAYASAKAGPGTLGGTATASVPAFSPHERYSSISASTGAQFYDWITVNGPANSSVLLNFSITVNGSYLIVNPQRGNVHLTTSLVVTGPGNLGGTAVQRLEASTGEFTGNRSFQLLVPTGTRLHLAGNLQTGAGVIGGSGVPGGVFANAAYGNTAHFYVDLAEPSPQYQLLSDSGHSFTSSVAAPEPGTFALAALGLLALPIRRVLHHRSAK